MVLEMSMCNLSHSDGVEAGLGLVHVESDEAHDKSSVADLSAATIDDMTSAELARVIQAAGLPRMLDYHLEQRLDVLDRPTLQRLAHVARRCCRNQGY